MDTIYFFLITLNMYFFLHFLWIVMDHFFEWKIRLTGTTYAYDSQFGNQGDVETVKDPKQSTLYHWWTSKTHNVQNMQNTHKKIELIIKSAEKNAPKPLDANEIHELKIHTRDLNSSLSQINGLLQHPRIPISLKRFDRWFYYMSRSRDARWLFMEMSMPLMLGTISIYQLGVKVNYLDIVKDLVPFM